MAKRIGAEALIIALFTALPEDSKRIVMDLLKAQTATPRKQVVKKGKPAPTLTATVAKAKAAGLLPENPAAATDFS